MAVISTLKDFKLLGKTVFLRLDLNVPLSAPDSETGERTVLDDTRIVEALPTIKFLSDNDARVVIASHLGRPDGKVDPQYSLEPVANRLAALLGEEITLLDDCVGDGIELMVKGLKNGEIVLLENLRFHKEEEANEDEFVKRLSKLGQIYINDAFGAAHRKHASTFGVPAQAPYRGLGYLMEKELKFLDPLLHQPAKPFYVLLGGSKVSDKIKTIETLIRKVDGLAIGGAMAYAFWAAQGRTLPAGAKTPKTEDVNAAREVLSMAKKREVPVLITEDTIESFDIGPKTIESLKKFLTPAKTLFWNGPLGWFEKSDYSHGTFEMARFIAELPAVSIVGGGDTVSAIRQAGVAEKFDHLSTGGGAVLEYLEGNGLPGVDVLKLTGREIGLMKAQIENEKRDAEDAAKEAAREAAKAARTPVTRS